MNHPLIIIGGGLSGLAAAIRFARFEPGVLILEKHSRIGGLNSYYYRNKRLIETGLHAITNFAAPHEKSAPLNRLFRQLKLKRSQLNTHEQIESEIRFMGRESLRFSNNFDLFYNEIARKFPLSLNGFTQLLDLIRSYDPFKPAPYQSARNVLDEHLNNILLTDMILCPLMYYGSSIQNDMDFGQFVIMFRAIFIEGFFRPEGTIKDFLDLLKKHLETFDGQIRLNSGVRKIIHTNKKVSGVELDSGQVIQCDNLLSTVGLEETFELLDCPPSKNEPQRLGFLESIFLINPPKPQHLPENKTIIFFNSGKKFLYQSPRNSFVDFNSGVICFPGNFDGLVQNSVQEIRTTHLADFKQWNKISSSRKDYLTNKKFVTDQSKNCVEKIIGKFSSNIIFEDSFTPITVERFTSKKNGAIYGSPNKIKDGDIGFNNLFIAGTDQGFLGIVGSMLSGVSMVNKHILTSL